jgi:hypothetical protein
MSEKPIPTEEEIAELLGRIQPRPEPRFHHRMSQQPWNRNGRALWGRIKSLRFAATLGLILILVIGVSIFTPSFDTLAQRLSQFFFPSESERSTVEIDPREISHPLERFDLSVAEAENLAGFQLKTPLELPPSFEFTGADYDEILQAAILNYTTPGGQLVLHISQQLLGSNYQSIGPTAKIESVNIGAFTGEYVAGGWKIPVPEVESGLEAEAIITTPQVVWDAEVNLQTLRWTDGTFLYEIMLAGDPEQPAHLDKNDLISLATHMQ